MLVIQMLSDQSVGLNGTIGIYLGHIHIVDEINEGLISWRSVVPPSLLLQRLLQNLLQHLRGGVEVEWYIGDSIVVGEGRQLLANQNSLATTRVAHQHDRMTFCHEQIQEISDPYRL